MSRTKRTIDEIAECELTDVDTERRRLRRMIRLFGNLYSTLIPMICSGFGDRQEIQSLEANLDRLQMRWRRHLAWLKRIGLGAVLPTDRKSKRFLSI